MYIYIYIYIYFNTINIYIFTYLYIYLYIILTLCVCVCVCVSQRTDCKAVVSVLPGELMGRDGFELSITLSEVHLPRMWVEQHPDKDSQVCVFLSLPFSLSLSFNLSL